MPWDKIIEQFLAVPILGALVLILGFLAWKFWGDLKKALESQIADGKTMALVLESTKQALAALTIATEQRNTATDAVAAANLKLAEGMSTLTRELELVQDRELEWRQEILRRLTRIEDKG